MSSLHLLKKNHVQFNFFMSSLHSKHQGRQEIVYVSSVSASIPLTGRPVFTGNSDEVLAAGAVRPAKPFGSLGVRVQRSNPRACSLCLTVKGMKKNTKSGA